MHYISSTTKQEQHTEREKMRERERTNGNKDEATIRERDGE